MTKSDSLRVLQIKHGLAVDGASQMVDNLNNAMIPLGVTFDVLVDEPLAGANEGYVSDIRRGGGEVYSIADAWEASGRLLPLKAFKLLYSYRVMRRGGYAAAHLQTDTPSRVQMLMVAKAARIPVRIAHSHSTSCNASQTELDRQLAYRQKMARTATDFAACSEDAARWLFPDDLVASGRVAILNNGIDVDRYRFDEGVRARMRRDLGVEGRLVMVCVGRLAQLKNIPFAIDVCAWAAETGANPVLLVVGDGEARADLEAHALSAVPADTVRFLGMRSDIPDLLQAADVLLMPSLFEGLPVALVEAQAASLPCVVSDAVSREADLSGSVTFLPLAAGAQAWAEAAVRAAGEARTDRSDAVKRSGFSIDEVAAKLLAAYRGQPMASERA